MNRRDTVSAMLALAASIAPLRGYTQQPGKVWRVGFISGNSRSTDQADIDLILRRLRELGHVEGRDFTAEYRWADGDSTLLTGFAGELARLKVDLIVTRSTPAALAAKAATREIPVVFSMVSDPVASGIVTSLARPGGNLTGWSNMLPDTSGKLLELLKEMAPKLSRVALLANPDNPGKVLEIARLKKAAGTMGLNLQHRELRTPGDLDPAFAQMPRERPDGLVVLSDSVTFTQRKRIVDFAAKQRLTAIYQVREFVVDGGLMSYGLNINAQQLRTAEYMHRIFKGARPADLPVEQPTQFEFVINGKTVKALGLKIPQSLLASVDAVIE